ncbi:hypothetical protein OESDEN_03725 [Oesophagostomum dentatum]|uniref:Uncharacterized protein n=1 Tax=Oesophagostomum dentatum TaxID=61180 RepID=A0A0B1TKG1_OESDE|nr:hypothetical protein OESDEN_03725 [Oesophagostomum dentatum]
MAASAGEEMSKSESASEYEIQYRSTIQPRTAVRSQSRQSGNYVSGGAGGGGGGVLHNISNLPFNYELSEEEELGLSEFVPLISTNHVNKRDMEMWSQPGSMLNTYSKRVEAARSGVKQPDSTHPVRMQTVPAAAARSVMRACRRVCLIRRRLRHGLLR